MYQFSTASTPYALIFVLCFSLFLFLSEAYSPSFEQNATAGALLTNLIDYPRNPRPCDLDKIQQTDVTYAQIRAQGWTVTNNTSEYDFAGATEAYQFIRVKVEIDNDNIYDFYIDFGEGVVVIATIKKKREGLYRWSQVLPAMWKYLAPDWGKNAKISSLKSIVQYRIDNDRTKDIIKEINEANVKKLDTLNQKIDVKPLSIEGKALIVTPNGRGHAYLLFEHIDDFKDVVITRVVLMNAVGVLSWEVRYGPKSQLYQR